MKFSEIKNNVVAILAKKSVTLSTKIVVQASHTSKGEVKVFNYSYVHVGAVTMICT